MVYKVSIPAFVGGEINRLMRGRVDQDVYFKSLLLGRNCYTSPQGWLLGREGQEFIDHTPDGGQVRLVTFDFGDPGTGVQAYLLEFSEKRMRVFKSGVLQASYDDGDDADLAALTYSVVDEMGFTADADTLLLTHVSMQPLRITRTSDTTWTFEKVVFKNIPVYAYDGVTVTNPAFTLTPSAATGEITLTTSGAFWDGPTHLKQYVVVNRGLVFITEVTSTTVAVGLVISDLSSTNVAASGAWDLETGYEDVWGNTRGWPAEISFFRGRLYLSGGARPQTTWASKVGDFFNLDQGDGQDDDGFEFTLDDDGVNAIINLYPGRTLQIFTTGGEFFVRSSTTKPITPTNIVDLVEKASRHGSDRVRPVDLDGATLYVEGGVVLRDFIYDDVQQSYTSEGRSDLADHMIKSPVDMAVRRARGELPFDHVFMVNGDGSVALMNSKRDPKVDFSAWNSWDTAGYYERVAVVDREVYFVVRRELESGTVRSIEKLNADHMLDYSKHAVSGIAITDWPGFDHLAGETVKVRGDGFNLQDATVALDGELVNVEATLTVEAGLDWLPRVVPMPADIDVNGKTLTGEWRRLVYVNILVENCDEIMVRRNVNGTTRDYRPPWRYFGDLLLDQPIPRKSDWVKIFVDGVSREPQIEITRPAPGRFQILAMTMGVS